MSYVNIMAIDFSERDQDLPSFFLHVIYLYNVNAWKIFKYLCSWFV